MEIWGQTDRQTDSIQHSVTICSSPSASVVSSSSMSSSDILKYREKSWKYEDRQTGRLYPILCHTLQLTVSFFVPLGPIDSQIDRQALSLALSQSLQLTGSFFGPGRIDRQVDSIKHYYASYSLYTQRHKLRTAYSTNDSFSFQFIWHWSDNNTFKRKLFCRIQVFYNSLEPE